MGEGERPGPESDRPLPLGPREPTKENYTPAVLHDGKHYTGPYHDAAYRAMASELDVTGEALKRAVFASQLGFVIGGVFYNDRDAMKIFKASVDPKIVKALGDRRSLSSDDVD